MKRRAALFLLGLALVGPAVPLRPTEGREGPLDRQARQELQVRILEAVEYLLEEVERHAEE